MAVGRTMVEKEPSSTHEEAEEGRKKSSSSLCDGLSRQSANKLTGATAMFGTMGIPESVSR